MPLSVGIIGIIVAFVLMNYLVYKGLNVVLTATLVTFIIVLTSGLSIGEAWNAGMGGVGALLGILGPIIMFGAVLGMFYTKSGAAASLADALVKPFINAKNMKKRIIGCLAMIFILRIIIGLAGIDNMAIMYTMLAIAAGVFAKCGIPRKYLNVLLMVAGTCGTLVPGAPMSVLITIEQYIPGFRNSGSIVLRSILLIIYVVVAVVIMYSMIKRDMDRGETYDPGPLAFPDTSEQKVPHPLLTILPILAVYLLYNFLPTLMPGWLWSVALWWPQWPLAPIFPRKRARAGSPPLLILPTPAFSSCPSPSCSPCCLALSCSSRRPTTS